MRVPLSYDDVHKKDAFKVRHYWDGWNLVFIRYSPTAYIGKNAVFRKNKWYAVIDTVVPNSNGVWMVRSAYVS